MMNIEETLKIMIKGAADFTNIEEIKKTLEQVNKEERPLRIKLGLDPSAPDIHIGHAVVLRKIKQLQDLGHEAIIIIGDFTGMIGDPTGKSKTRKQLSKEEVIINAKTYQDQIFKIIDPNKTTVKYNSEWFDKMNFRDIIELCSKCTVARILERDDFSNRYKNQQPISVHEFFYPLMQAYDSVAIKADIELGGTDQTFNINMGRNIQKDFGQNPQITLLMPILEGIDGIEKMSKSLGNYIGVNEDATTIYTKVMKIPDNLIIKYYELCTDIHPDQIEIIKQRLAKGENPRDIKMELSKEITGLYHSKEETEKAEQDFKTIFQQQQAPQDVLELNYDNTSSNISQSVIDAIMSTGNFKSKGEIRRLLQQGAIKANGEKILSFEEISQLTDSIILQIGKGKFFKLNASNS
ncbi:MAG: tyrosine--tRNA ligase [Clostridia bacterium]|nr:tyrosine--tRNA ligase [Clostridia bacterium]